MFALPTFFPLSVTSSPPPRHWHPSLQPALSLPFRPFFFSSSSTRNSFSSSRWDSPLPPGHSTTSRRSSTFRGTMHISPIFMEFLLDSFLLLQSTAAYHLAFFFLSFFFLFSLVCHFSLSLLRGVYFSRPVALPSNPHRPGDGFSTEIFRLTPLNRRSIKRNNIPLRCL